jgi:hypothetical protein
MTCDLAVYEISKGRLIGLYPRKPLWGLCWITDSRGVLFTSLRNETLHDKPLLDRGWQTIFPDAQKVFSDAPTYRFDIETGAVTFFGEMTSLCLAAEAEKLAYPCEPDSVVTFDPVTGETNQVQIGQLSDRETNLSPDARFALVCLTLRTPTLGPRYPIIVSLTEPQRRYYLDGFYYRLDWTTEVEDPAILPAGASPALGAGEARGK